MAEGFAKTLGEGKIEVTSSGLEASRVHPTAIEVMSDIGIDISNQTSDASWISLISIIYLNFNKVVLLKI